VGGHEGNIGGGKFRSVMATPSRGGFRFIHSETQKEEEKDLERGEIKVVNQKKNPYSWGGGEGESQDGSAGLA